MKIDHTNGKIKRKYRNNVKPQSFAVFENYCKVRNILDHRDIDRYFRTMTPYELWAFQNPE